MYAKCGYNIHISENVCILSTNVLHIGKCNIIIQYISSYFIFTAAGDFGSLFVS